MRLTGNDQMDTVNAEPAAQLIATGFDVRRVIARVMTHAEAAVRLPG